jgi:tetratricopeptide (TPR) repeat protein
MFAQDEDALRQQIRVLGPHAGSDTAYSSACLQLGERLLYNNPVEAASLLLKSATGFSKLNYPEQAAYAYHRAGLANEQAQMNGIALDCYLKASKIYEAIGSPKGIAYALLDIGMVYYHQQMYPMAFSVFRKAEKMFMSIGDKAGLIKCYNDLGVTYRESGQSDSSAYYFRKAIAACSTINNRSRIAETVYHLGVYLLSENQTDSAKAYFSQALSLLAVKGSQSDEDIVLQGKIVNRLANMALAKSDFKSAESYYLDAVRVFGDPLFKLQNATALQRLGEFYFNRRRFEESFTILNKALSIETACNFLREEKETRACIAKIYAQKGDLRSEAAELLIITTLADSLLNLDTKHKLYDLETMLSTIGAENEIARLREKNKSGAIHLFAILTIFAMSGFFVIYRFRVLRKNSQFSQDLSDNLFQGIAITTDDIVVVCNEKLASLAGIKQDELIGKKISDFIAGRSINGRDDNLSGKEPITDSLLSFPAANGKQTIVERQLHYHF